MTNREFEILYKKTCLEVADKALNAALLNTKLMIAELMNPYYEDQRQEIETTYLNMLNYVINAVPDPEQESIYNKIQIRILELADTVRDIFFTKEFQSIYWSVYLSRRIFTLWRNSYSNSRCLHWSAALSDIFYLL